MAIEKGKCLVDNRDRRLISVAILPPKELMSDSGEYYRITCRFCDTITTVTPEQAGTVIKCPDCFSVLEVGDLAGKNKSTPASRSERWRGGKKAPKQDASAVSQSADEFKLSETFERPAVSPLFGLDPVAEDLLAPRKRGNATETNSDDSDSTTNPAADSNSSAEKNKSSQPSKQNQEAGFDVDAPLEVDEILSLEAIGTLVPESEPTSEQSQTSSNRPVGSRGGRPSKKRSRRETTAASEVGARRPKFKPALLFMATVSMLTDVRVLLAGGIAALLMLVGGIASESIFPVGGGAEATTFAMSIYKYFLSFLFGGVPYCIGLVGLWTVAGFIFRDAFEGHGKVQGFSVSGKSEFWSSFLLFGFSFFIAGLPGAILQVMIIPLRMLIAPLFLISAWFNGSPWKIISTDWYHVVSENKSQWLTVYAYFGGLAFVGLMAGGVFLARYSTDLVAVDIILTSVGIIMNTVITLVFAAIAGWHAGAVIESLD